MGYEVKLERFEGPLDLLIHLIQRDEIDIYDIPIARITQHYLNYIELMRLLDLDVAGEFLVMAATLMRIKAKMLLPTPQPGEEEEIDPRDELVQRLLEYRQFKEAAGTLKTREEHRRLEFERGLLPDEDEAGPLPLAPATLFHLLDALNRVLARLPARTVMELEGEAYDIEERIESIANRVRVAGALSFETLLSECRSRLEMIVTFLALLELLKMARLVASQEGTFGEITLALPTDEALPSEWDTGDAAVPTPRPGAKTSSKTSAKTPGAPHGSA